jgi:hypothetical protein
MAYLYSNGTLECFYKEDAGRDGRKHSTSTSNSKLLYSLLHKPKDDKNTTQHDDSHFQFITLL